MSAEFRKFPLLTDLEDAELEELARHFTAVTLDRGEYLFREGEPGNCFYLLDSGLLVVERDVNVEAGERKDIAILPPLSAVGEMAIADEEPRSATVRAELPIHAFRMDRQHLASLVEEHPGIALKLFRSFFRQASRRLRSTNEQLVAVYEVGRLVAGAREPLSAARLVLLCLVGRLKVANALVALYEPHSNRLRVAHALGKRGESLVGLAIPLDQGLPARAFDERRPLLVERLLGATEPWESSSMLLIPMVERNQAHGVLLLGSEDGSVPFSLADLSLAMAVANISAPLLREAFSPA